MRLGVCGTTMNIWEKICSISAIVFALCLVSVILIFPELRQLDRLLAACLLGIFVNAGLMFIVLRDIFLRRFSNPNVRFIWVVVVLFFWPSIPYYLFLHGFRPRN